MDVHKNSISVALAETKDSKDQELWQDRQDGGTRETRSITKTGNYAFVEAAKQYSPRAAHITEARKEAGGLFRRR